ncbi:hypothetical protein LguiA_025383 [Lonicera macranthoides]
MEDWYSDGLSKKKKNRGLEEEDLQEEQVWDVLKQREDSSTPKWVRKGKGKDQQLPQWRLPAAPKVIPRANSNSDGKIVNLAHHHLHHQSSAPVNIPQWSKSYYSSEKGLSLRDDDYGDGSESTDGYNHDDEYEDDHDEGIVPPHEYIARRVARSQIASFSMCEGIGRTLKGRDLSKLRNAILTKTGFLE